VWSDARQRRRTKLASSSQERFARADLFISQARDGELLITSRQDGAIRMLVPDSAASGTMSNQR